MVEPLRTTLFFDDTEDLAEGYDLLPLGSHEFVITEVRSQQAKTGRGRLGLKVEISGEEDPAKGRKGWDNWNLPDPEKDERTSRIYKFWKQVAKACPDAIVTESNGIQRFNPDGLVGMKYRATVVHEDFDGKKRDRLEWPYPMGKEEKQQSRPSAFGPVK